MDKYVFHGLHNLNELQLVDNMISELDYDIFQGLNKLILIQLNHNQLTVLPNIGLIGPSLETVDFEYNQVAFLDCKQFNNLTNLIVIDGGMNKIK